MHLIFHTKPISKFSQHWRSCSRSLANWAENNNNIAYLRPEQAIPVFLQIRVSRKQMVWGSVERIIILPCPRAFSFPSVSRRAGLGSWWWQCMSWYLLLRPLFAPLPEPRLGGLTVAGDGPCWHPRELLPVGLCWCWSSLMLNIFLQKGRTNPQAAEAWGLITWEVFFWGSSAACPESATMQSCLQGKKACKAAVWASVKWAMKWAVFSPQWLEYATHSLSRSFPLTVCSVAGQISHHQEYTQLQSCCK